MRKNISRRKFLTATGAAGFVGISGCFSDKDLTHVANYGEYNHYGNGSRPAGGYWIAGFFVPTDSQVVGFGYQMIVRGATGSNVYYDEGIEMHDERINPTQDEVARTSTDVDFRATDMELWVFDIYKDEPPEDEPDTMENWGEQFNQSNTRLIPFLKQNVAKENVQQGSYYSVSVPSPEKEENQLWVNENLQELILSDSDSEMQPR